MAKTGDERVRQVVAGVALLLGITALVCGALMGWRFLPGLLGEWAGLMIGVMTTPFLMEASFVILGLFVVFGINHWRRKRNGDECVYLEELGDPHPKGLPEHATWAVYLDKPLPGVTPTLREQAEGALEIGEIKEAAECIAAMDEDELAQPATLEVRMALAKATGRHDLAMELETRCRDVRDPASPQNPQRPDAR